MSDLRAVLNHRRSAEDPAPPVADVRDRLGPPLGLKDRLGPPSVSPPAGVYSRLGEYQDPGDDDPPDRRSGSPRRRRDSEGRRRRSPMAMKPIGGGRRSRSPLPMKPIGGGRRSRSPLPMKPIGGGRRSRSPLPMKPIGGGRRSRSPRPSRSTDGRGRSPARPKKAFKPIGGGRRSRSRSPRGARRRSPMKFKPIGGRGRTSPSWDQDDTRRRRSRSFDRRSRSPFGFRPDDDARRSMDRPNGWSDGPVAPPPPARGWSPYMGDPFRFDDFPSRHRPSSPPPAPLIDMFRDEPAHPSPIDDPILRPLPTEGFSSPGYGGYDRSPEVGFRREVVDGFPDQRPFTGGERRYPPLIGYDNPYQAGVFSPPRDDFNVSFNKSGNPYLDGGRKSSSPKRTPSKKTRKRTRNRNRKVLGQGLVGKGLPHNPDRNAHEPPPPAPKKTKKKGDAKVVAKKLKKVEAETKKPEPEGEPRCFDCRNPKHYTYECDNFQKRTVEKRWSKIEEDQSQCVSCLRPGHPTRRCEKEVPCGVGGCTEKHHHMLHRSEASETEQRTSCISCHQRTHHAPECSSFEKWTVEKRWLMIQKSINNCRICLQHGHTSEECPDPKPCSVAGCEDKEKHHTMLHISGEEYESSDDDDDVAGGVPTCLCCESKNHDAISCELFGDLSVMGRWKKVEKSSLNCIWCLRRGHRRDACEKTRPCGINGCTDKHHPLLHDTTTDKILVTDTTAADEGKVTVKETVCHHCGSKDHVIKFCRALVCFKCGEPDHVTLKCPNPLVKLNWTKRTTCINCKIFGHHIKDCRKPLDPKLELTCYTCLNVGHSMAECHESEESKHRRGRFIPQHMRFRRPAGIPLTHLIKQANKKALEPVNPEDESALSVAVHSKVKVCVNCNTVGHLFKDCPETLRPGLDPEVETSSQPSNERKRNIVCTNCLAQGHHYSECPEGQRIRGAIEGMAAGKDTSSVRNCYNCLQYGHSIKKCPELKSGAENSNSFKKQITCFKCLKVGHHMRNCPTDGGGGIEVTPDPIPTSAQSGSFQSASIDYGHSVSVPKPNLAPLKRPNRSILTYLCERVLAKGKSILIAEEMMVTWRLAGHNEDSLFNLIEANDPPTKAKLRLLLVHELQNAPPASIPLGVTVSDLLDDTVEYFMPEDRIQITAPAPLRSDYVPGHFGGYGGPQSSYGGPQGGYGGPQGGYGDAPSTSGNFGPGGGSTMGNEATRLDVDGLQSAINTISSMEKSQHLDDLIKSAYESDPKLYEAFEGRLQSFEPLRQFIWNKMNMMSSAYGVSDSYVESVSGLIPKLLAHVEFTLFTMKRMYSLYGEDPMVESLMEKLSPMANDLPTGVTVKFITSIVCDYLREQIKDF